MVLFDKKFLLSCVGIFLDHKLKSIILKFIFVFSILELCFLQNTLLVDEFATIIFASPNARLLAESLELLLL